MGRPQAAVVVDGLAKRYRVTRRMGRADRPREVWALRDLTFAVMPGTRLGILGRNGAGKTTLIKVLARTTPPTAGRAVLRGRIAPPLGLATSFLEPHLTVRENASLLTVLLGAPHREAGERIEEILAFAELTGRGEVELSRCSSGFAARLAFSTVMALEPDILLADGVPAPGDSDFRGRAEERLSRAGDDGLTLLLATESVKQVRRFCDRALWLEGGRVVAHGSVDEVAQEYEASQGRKKHRGRRPKPSHDEKDVPPGLPANAVAISGMVVRPSGEGDALSNRTPTAIDLTLELRVSNVRVRCAVAIIQDGTAVQQVTQTVATRVVDPGEYLASVELPPGAIPTGAHVIRAKAAVAGAGGRKIASRETKVMVAQGSIAALPSTGKEGVWEVRPTAARPQARQTHKPDH